MLRIVVERRAPNRTPTYELLISAMDVQLLS